MFEPDVTTLAARRTEIFGTLVVENDTEVRGRGADWDALERPFLFHPSLIAPAYRHPSPACHPPADGRCDAA